MLWVLIRIASPTHNIHFYGEVRKLSFSYHQKPALSVLLER